MKKSVIDLIILQCEKDGFNLSQHGKCGLTLPEDEKGGLTVLWCKKIFLNHWNFEKKCDWELNLLTVWHGVKEPRYTL